MFPKIEDISDVLEQMENLTPSEKTHFAAIFESIKNKQEKLFNNLKQEIKSELQNKEHEEIDIYTMLVDSDKKKELKEYNIFDVCDGCKPLEKEKITLNNLQTNNLKEYYCGLVFWNDSYELMENMVDKKYVANMIINNEKYEVTFSLRNTNLFILKEKQIQKIAIQYGIEKPLIYNPMARRALEVLISFPRSITKNDNVEIDFCFENNNLKKYLLLNKYLMWNIFTKPFDELPDPKAGEYKEVLPLWDYTFKTYKFSTKGEKYNIKDFLLIENDLRIIKRVGNDIYWQIKDMDTEMIYEKYSIFLLDSTVKKTLCSQIGFFYHNDYSSPETGMIERIRTKADAMRVISGFSSLNISCKDVYTGTEIGNEKIVYTYPKRMDYYQVKDERLCTARTCKVLFEVKESDKMYVDKISYIISFLNHRYPEYRWIGVN